MSTFLCLAATHFLFLLIILKQKPYIKRLTKLTPFVLLLLIVLLYFCHLFKLLVAQSTAVQCFTKSLLVAVLV